MRTVHAVFNYKKNAQVCTYNFGGALAPPSTYLSMALYTTSLLDWISELVIS